MFTYDRHIIIENYLIPWLWSNLKQDVRTFVNIFFSHLELRLDLRDQVADSLPRGVPLLRAPRPLRHLRRPPRREGGPGQGHAQGYISLQLYREKLGQKIFKLSQISVCWIQRFRSPQPEAPVSVRRSGGGWLQ